MKEGIISAAQSTKVAGATAIATMGSGTGTLFDIIPDDIGKLATVIGLILSTILIGVQWNNLHKVRAERAIAELEKKRLEGE